MKKREKQIYEASFIFDQEAREKAEKRYEYICYAKLVLRALVLFILGLLVSHFIGL